MFSEGQAKALDSAKVAAGDLSVYSSQLTTLLDAVPFVRSQHVAERVVTKVNSNADGLVVCVEAREYSQETLEPTGKTT